MKFFLIFLIVLVLLNGCSKNNAFDHFYMSKKQEITQENIQNIELKKKDKSLGVVNIVYLNNILDDKYKTKEVFYIYMYADIDYDTIIFTLDGKVPSKTKALTPINEFKDLTMESYTWQKYFLVEFEKNENEKMVFEILSDSITPKKLVFGKIEY
jgi:hypothetical protein